MSQDIIQTMRYMQVRKAIGELEALKVSYYSSMDNHEQYYKACKIIDAMIDELKCNFG